MRLRNRHFLLLDLILLSLMPALALVLRVDSTAWIESYPPALIQFTVLSLLIKIPLFYFFGLYRRYWRYASIDELINIILAVATATIVVAAVFFGWRVLSPLNGQGLPRSVPFIDGLLTLMVVGGTRFSERAIEHRRSRGDRQENRKPVLIVGAGDAGAMIIREIKTSPRINLEPIGFVDDDASKQGMIIHGVPVLGTRRQIPQIVQDYGIQEVIIAMPTAAGTAIREIMVLCEAAQVPSRTMPGIFEILSGKVGVNHLRNVEIEDLLRREPVAIDTEDVRHMLAGARVLVTGAGGSIGSELCRQIARLGPARLTLLGHGENSLFAIEHELRFKWPQIPLDVTVADIRDAPRMKVVFERTRPQVVFHAAAHKHVPMMESNIEEAVTNNVVGTRTLVNLSKQYDVERFVLISSDKAVNPVNVMGATKSVAETIVQQAARRTRRPYVSVRFGNVLGSRGSVIPTFREQIARGGPVTITHPDIRRYFMTIPEAVQLVLQAAALGTDSGQGEVFVLDMGEPIKIVDLAKDLIELSGLEVGRDIEIQFTGLRPGEKLYEELFVEGEEYRRTQNEKVFAVHSPLLLAEAGDDERASLEAQLDELIKAAELGQPEKVRQLLEAIAPNYSPVAWDPDNPFIFPESLLPPNRIVRNGKP